MENHPAGKGSIKRGSLKGFRYFLNADGVFFSHSLSDILPQLHRIPILFARLKRPKKVFIQHGVTAVTGLRKVDHYIRKNMAAANFIIVTSEVEKALIMKLGISEMRIKIAGFPIHDDASFCQWGKKILVFFTWQKTPTETEKSQEIANDSQILNLLRDHKYELIVHHHDMNPRQNYRISADGIRSWDNDSLKKAIEEAHLLITDNSSVAWDFFYCGCDVIFYKPNSDSRVDLRKAGFHVANKIQELSVLLESAFHQQLPLTDTKRCFAFKDRKNCERVYNLIQ